MTAPAPLALLYDDDAYRETVSVGPRARGGPAGLMGRQVAGKEFLDAYLRHSTWNELVAVVRDQRNAESFERLCRSRVATPGAKRWRVVGLSEFHRTFFSAPAARQLYLPGPLDSQMAWARHASNPGAFALSGVTYTICSSRVVESLCALLTAPFEPFDALVCVSRAAEQVVRRITTAYADYLRELHGGQPRLRAQLEVIPLGVDTEKFRPPTPEERARRRQECGVGEDEVAVLFVGRLSFHAKANPFPMFQGLSDAARQSGRKVHLILSGWAANKLIRSAFESSARLYAPNVRVSFIDSLADDKRASIWHAADVFTSFADNPQESFGLVITQAMACGLPVVASDWNGYRDLVVDNETGHLVPSYLVDGATRDATARLLIGETSFDHFLADCSQATIVDVGAAGRAFRALLSDEALRQRLGEAGRERAVRCFGWDRIIPAYEELWRSQEEERQAYVRAGQGGRSHIGPACYPSPEHSFADYPSRVLTAADTVQSVRPGDLSRLHALLSTAISSHRPETRSADAALLRSAMKAARTPCTVAQLDELFREAGVADSVGRATIAWMLKYDLLRVVADSPADC